MGLVVALALGASLLFGASDFLGAFTARSLSVIKASTVIYFAATVASALALPFVPWGYSDGAFWSGVIAGVLGLVGTVTFYAALAIGPMSLLAPLIALIQTAVPVFVAATTGQNLQLLAWIAVGLAFAATTLISVPARAASGEPARERITARGGLLALVSGIMLGFSVVSLDTAPADSGAFAAVTDLAVGFLLLLPLVAMSRFRNSDSWLGGAAAQPSPGAPLELERPGPATWAWSALAGVLLGVGDALLVVALHSGNLAIVAVLVSLYPVGTIVLARLVLKERISIVQFLGVALAIVTAVLLGVS